MSGEGDLTRPGVYKSYREFRTRFYGAEDAVGESADACVSFGKELAKRVLQNVEPETTSFDTGVKASQKG